jgi:hypothetical protein
VGTGNYYDGSANLRLINETFLTDSVFFEVDYELIWAGGDIVRKQNELKEIFPNLSGDVFFLGAPLDDDRRLMDLTHTIKEEDSWFLLQRLDRLYLALNWQWGSVRVGRQAVTWGNGFVFNPMDLFNPFPPTSIDRDYKVGDDMINAQFSLPHSGDIQLLYVARRNPDTSEVDSDQASVAGQAPVVEKDDEKGEKLEQPVHANPASPDDASGVHGYGRGCDQAYLAGEEAAPYPIDQGQCRQAYDQSGDTGQRLVELAEDKGCLQVGEDKAVRVKVSGGKDGQTTLQDVARGPGGDKLVDKEADLLDVAPAKDQRQDQQR